MRTRAAGARLGVACALVGALLGACGGPEDPFIPPSGDAGVDAELPATTCVGSPDGAPCAGGKICVGGTCLDPACGDGLVTPPEECDRGAGNQAGSGCEPTCKFTCADGDGARGCASAVACVAPGTCDAQLHTCKAGSPQADGTACGPSKMCAGGQCIDSSCGDGVVAGGEQCDNGIANGPGKGCETTCKFSCSVPATDCAPVPCNTLGCSALHVCQTTPDPTKNGQACGTNLVCSNGACIAPGAVCGNGVKEGGEDCDFGAQNGPGTGCESTCKFSCATAANCVDPNACHVPPTCDPVTVNGMAGQRCVTGANRPDGFVCGTGAICLGVVCKTSVCGDGYRDAARGEQCDDSNTVNLDGCDGMCRFEQDQRVIGMTMQYGTNAYCTVNAMGGAIAGPAQSSLQTSINDSIADGSLSAMFKMVGDPTGASGAVTGHSLSGTPVAGAGYSGTSDLDWWYTVSPTAIDGMRNGLAQVTGTYSGGAANLTGTLNLVMSIGGSLTVLRVTSAKMTGTIGAPATIPTVSAAGATPGHIAAEHLSPTLTAYPTWGGTRQSQNGEMCGNVSANSLANTAVPASLLPGGSTPCLEGYTSANRAIDLFVNGCTVRVVFVNVTAIRKTQPDQVDPSAPVAGAGGNYVLSVDPTTKRVNQCRDKNGAVVNLNMCLSAAAYSSFFRFATDRVIIK